MELWIGALNLGFLYAFMTMGVFITFRIFDFPDITVDGSFTAGASVAAVLIISGINPFLALIGAFFVGMAAGCITALIHTRLNVNSLLAGILVMTGLYSINLHIMGRSNIPLLNRTSFMSFLEGLNPGLNMEIWTCIALAVVMALFWLAVSLFLKTDLGITMRVTGSNPNMSSATGVSVGGMKVFGVAFANGLTALSGGLVAQYQGFADIGMGIGTIVIGLAAVIIGESVLRMRSIYVIVLSVILGSVIFRLMIAVALFVGMNPIDLKLLTALFVFLTLLISKKVTSGKEGAQGLLSGFSRIFSVRWLRFAIPALFIIILAGSLIYRQVTTGNRGTGRVFKIGFVQVADNGLLNLTRDSFVREMERIGYRQGEDCRIMLENANGELSTVNTILDKFLQEGVDIIVPISTACTQAAVNRVKDRPVVFATVANPFIIGAGTSETEHLPNVTGVYGWVPMDRTIKIVRRILPGKLKIGAIWDPAHANSVFNVENLQKVIGAYEDLEFTGATITSSSEVFEAARSLVYKDIDVFVLSPDNIVYSAFESVVKAARIRKIPIFLSDVERLADGALGALGYDYSISGVQAAHLVDRVLRGEDPKDIPFERYSRLTIGFNLDVAEEIGISIPSEILEEATDIYPERPAAPAPSVLVAAGKQKRVALFLFSKNYLMMKTARGLKHELEKTGYLKAHNITIDMKSAQNDFSMAQSVAQDIVRQKYDYIITLSTPALQVMAQVNREIPHVFGAVTDPYRMGVARSPGDHLPNITGVATFQPVETTLRVMRELFPRARRVGIVWNPGEACSEACTLMGRKAALKYGFDLIEANVSGTGEVMDAIKSLLNRELDLFWTSGDNTVNMALDSIAVFLKTHGIPYFTNTPSDVVGHGALVSIGADYYEVGKETARMALRVFKGESPEHIPIRDFVPETMHVNLALAKELGIELPEEFVKRAAFIKE